MDDSAIPQVNFRLTLEERVRALGGPPAYIRRRRTIEDLLEEIAKTARTLRGELDAREARALRKHVERTLARLHELIDNHNRYYPMEANLPVDVRTGALVERGGVPWRPLAKPTLREILGEGAEE
jgi:hypothetical protein